MNSRSKIVGLTRHLPDETESEEHSVALGSIEVDQSHILSAEDINETGLDEAVFYEENETQDRRWTAFIAPALLGLALVAWTGFFSWTYFAEARLGLNNDRIAGLIGTWSVPALLIAVLWLLYMRNSRAEADRFGDAARLLRTESEALELRMRTVNEEIAMAREFLAQNARELETVGRQSARNLVEAAEQLGTALADSDEKAKTLEAVSNAATSNLEQLRKHLPVVTSAAKDVTNQIGSAGNSAQLQVKSLIASLQRVGDAGKSARQYIDDMEVRATEAGEKLEANISSSAALLSESAESAEARTTEMTALMAAAVFKLTGSVMTASGDVDRIVVESGSKIDEQLGALRDGIGKLAAQSADEEARISQIMGRISVHIENSASRIAEVDAAATDQTAKLAFAVSALGVSTKDVGVALSDNKDTTDELLGRSEKLLVALEAANREIDVTLPASIKRMDDRFADSIRHLSTAAESAEILDAHSDNLLAKLTSLEHLIASQRSSAERLMAESDEQFAARHEQADALATALNHTRSLIEEMTGNADGKLVASLLKVHETTRQAAESSRKILDEELTSVAERLTEQNKALLAGAVDNQVSAINEMMQSSIERNIALSETATTKMAAQLSQIDEMTGNLEQRLTAVRDGFDGVDNDSFARQMVLLTESLNSTAIDVAKIMSNEVTDTAWAAYLKGDRGVFTRRAVRLLDAGEARTIADHYGDDSEFREHVNRYIHDFEAMMRVLLSTRDGNAIGVTLLSSDVGKLYVALAQAIERLRN
jgi:hypothetical protein